MACSATLSSDTLQTVMKSLHVDPTNHVLVNKGNFRPNIFWDVIYLSGTTNAIPEIRQCLPPMPFESERIPLTIIFVNSISDGHSVLTYLQQSYPDSYARQVVFFHSLLSPRTKAWIFRNCMVNKSGIYICTEIAAMVSLLPLSTILSC